MAYKYFSFNGTITQSAPDSFEDRYVGTNIPINTDYGIVITEVRFSLEPVTVANWAPAAVQWFRATLGLGNFFKGAFYAPMVRAVRGGAGSLQISTEEVWSGASDPIVQSSLYLSMDSGGTGQQNIMDYRIRYRKVKMTSAEVLRISAREL